MGYTIAKRLSRRLHGFAGEELLKLLHNVLRRAGIAEEDVVAIGTDTEAAICAAMRASNINHFGCAMHRFDLTMKVFTKIPGARL